MALDNPGVRPISPPGEIRGVDKFHRAPGSGRQLYREFFAGGAGTETGERYVAPMYNRLVADGDLLTMSVVPLDDVGMLGTPEQVERFRRTRPAGADSLFMSEL